MTVIDQRILRAGVEVSGEIRWYEGGASGFSITARGSKLASDVQNSCDVEIVNLSRDVRNYLLTETSPFNKNRTPKKLIIEAGRVSTGVARVFMGDITFSDPTQPPDIGLNMKAQTGAFQKGNLVARSGRAQEKLSEISKKVADDIGASLEFEAEDKQIANYSFSGAAIKQVNALGMAGNVDAFHDDDVLVIKDYGQPRKNRVKVVNSTTGMIGIPEVTERGVKVQFLYDLDTELGAEIQLSSELNPSLNGSYTIYKLDFELASRDTPWYYIAEASRND